MLVIFAIVYLYKEIKFKPTLLELFSGREKNDCRNYFMIYGTKLGSNSRPLDLQSDSHLLPDTLQTALRGLVNCRLLQNEVALLGLTNTSNLAAI